MRILITGIHGFVGSSVGFWALTAGHQVLGLDLPAQPPAGWSGAYEQLDVAHANVASPIESFDPHLLLHAAGAASVAGSYSDPVADLRTSVLTWANTLDGVRRSKSRPLVVYPSSAAVYGEPVTLPVHEDSSLAPISPYGFHKAAGELLAAEYSTCFGLDILVVRLFSVYGPRQKRLLVWELFQRALDAGAELRLNGSGNESRDYSHIDDIAAALTVLASTGPTGLHILNLASGESVQTAALAHLVGKAAGCDKTVRALGQGQRGNPVNWSADISQLKSLIRHDFRPLAEGLKECIKAWR